jgi:beta-lactamase class C
LLAEDVEAGTVNLHDSAADYIPDLLGTAALKPIRLGNLASYTASFPLNLPNNVHTRSELAQALKTWQPTAPIGTVWQYSNVDFGLLGDALEVINHQSFNQMYRSQILSPLHMNPIGITVPDAYVSQMSTGYTAAGKMMPKSNLGLFPTAYALKATGGDMLRFLNASLGLSGTPSSIATAVQLTETPVVKVENWQQGLGWRINPPLALSSSPLPATSIAPKDQVLNPNARFEKTGATNGFRAYIVALPAQKTGVVILLNKNVPNDAIVSAGRKILKGIETPLTTT